MDDRDWRRRKTAGCRDWPLERVVSGFRAPTEFTHGWLLVER
jgi:hypothetical protein